MNQNEKSRSLLAEMQAQPPAEAQAQGGGEVPEAELIALVAGPYHYHHKMDEAAEREGKAFDRCRELTIQNIRTWCATRRAMLCTASPSAPVGVDGLMQLARNWCLAWGEWAHDADPGCAKENAAEAALRAALTTALAQQPAPLSAPVGVEGIAGRLRNLAAIMRGDGGTERIDGKAWERVEELAAFLEALAQQPAACPKCGGTGEADSGGIMPWGAPATIPCDCQQPAAVDGELVEQVASAIAIEDTGVSWHDVSPRDRAYYVRLARAALAAQLQGDNT